MNDKAPVLSPDEVQAVILAGGKGTRLRPITVDRPKPLVPICNRPIVEHQLRHLASRGIRDVTLALGYNADQFDGIVRDAEQLGVSVRVFTEPHPLGTGGALRWCSDQGAFDERPLLWMNGDVVTNADPVALTRFHQQSEANLTLWLTSVREVSEFGVLELASDGHVEQFLEKPAKDETESHLVNAGILMLDPQVLQRVPPSRFFSFEQELLPPMVGDGEPVYGMFDGGYWMDTGKPASYLAANRHVLEDRLNWEPAGQRTEAGLWEGTNVERQDVDVTHPAAIGDDAVLSAGAQLFGRTVLGNRVSVSSGAELENCVLFDDVQIGEGAVVINSVICRGARIGEGTVVSRSIIGPRSAVGSRNEIRRMRVWNDVQLPDHSVVADS